VAGEHAQLDQLGVGEVAGERLPGGVGDLAVGVQLAHGAEERRVVR